MTLFDQDIEADESDTGGRLNVVSFTGNSDLLRSTKAITEELGGRVSIRQTHAKPDVLMCVFNDMTQKEMRTIATVVRESGFRGAGTCYAACRHQTSPENNVDYLVAFE